MLREVTITTEAINESALIAQRQRSGSTGAAVYFVGLVRGTEAGKSIQGLEYESYSAMAEHQFQLILDEIEKRWPVESVRVMHRVGEVKVNEASVWIEVLSPHREEAFAACQYLIEQMKRVVPIWKKPI
jgi:molybdopterin synthase catalytic subunit